MIEYIRNTRPYFATTLRRTNTVLFCFSPTAYVKLFFSFRLHPNLLFFSFPASPGVCVAIEDSRTGAASALAAGWRYEKLMTKRVDWTSGADDDDDGDADNKCTCVWVGVAPHAHFEGRFKFETIRSHASARKRFQDKGLAHFFDAASAANAAADDAAED